MTVKFINVGGSRMTWEEALPNLEWSTLKKAVHRKGAIVSRYPEFDLNDDGRGGAIIAGFRTVGKFEVIS